MYQMKFFQLIRKNKKQLVDSNHKLSLVIFSKIGAKQNLEGAKIFESMKTLPLLVDITYLHI